MDNDQYWEGLVSLFDADPTIVFVSRPVGEWPLDERPETLRGLQAFSHNYLSIKEEQDALIVSDLRLGLANNLAFEFVFARRDNKGQWSLLDKPERHPGQRGFEHLTTLWQRLKGDQTINANLQRASLSLDK